MKDILGMLKFWCRNSSLDDRARQQSLKNFNATFRPSRASSGIQYNYTVLYAWRSPWRAERCIKVFEWLLACSIIQSVVHLVFELCTENKISPITHLSQCQSLHYVRSFTDNHWLTRRKSHKTLQYLVLKYSELLGNLHEQFYCAKREVANVKGQTWGRTRCYNVLWWSQHTRK